MTAGVEKTPHVQIKITWLFIRLHLQMMPNESEIHTVSTRGLMEMKRRITSV